jgi:GNAT superfamily N-acetyltransferase
MAGDPEKYGTSPIEPADASSGFRSGTHPLDDYFRRHAAANDALGIGRAYVLRRAPDQDQSLPAVLGYYTLSMALVASADIAESLERKLPKYPLPVALIGRLAVDERARGRRLGERLLIDALRRIADASEIIGCVGAIVDAKTEGAEAFYVKYDFNTIHADAWPHRMFLPMHTIKAALDGE